MLVKSPAIQQRNVNIILVTTYVYDLTALIHALTHKH